jgi:4-diphosphocytidyl-2C-methyl-D-erythritol kinase
MSGSGSAVFGWFSDLLLAKKAAESLKTECQVLALESVGRERYWQELSTGA